MPTPAAQANACARPRPLSHPRPSHFPPALDMHRYADWDRDEMLRVLMPDAWRRANGLPSRRAARREQLLQTRPDALEPIAEFVREMEVREEFVRGWRYASCAPAK
mmetsp:Transcript_41454/g.123847  ORF Transcript_41454/g.123847 Transcript_41454/m.123847 type:complete len:106 (-) Transcript_41454:244-561(-)